MVRILGSASHEAEDVIQETWIRAIQSLSRFHWRSQFRTWLCSIALNCCREFKRNEIPRAASDPQMLSVVMPKHPDVSDIERCVIELPDGCREVLVLHDIEGYTHKEIAEYLEISEGTSKSQLARARSKLRQMLKPQKEIS